MISEHCGILKNLLPDDILLAGHGFTIADSVGATWGKLHIPAFTKGKSQLATLEADTCRMGHWLCQTHFTAQDPYTLLQNKKMKGSLLWIILFVCAVH